MSDIINDMYGEDLKKLDNKKYKNNKKIKQFFIINSIISIILISGLVYIYQQRLAAQKAENAQNAQILAESLDASLDAIQEQRVRLWDDIELINYFNSYKSSNYYFSVNHIYEDGTVAEDGVYGVVDFPNHQLALGLSYLDDFSEFNVSRDLVSITDTLFVEGDFAGDVDDLAAIEEYLSLVYGLSAENVDYIETFLNTPYKENSIKITSSVNNMIESLITTQEITVSENVTKELEMFSLSPTKTLSADKYSLTINKTDLIFALDNFLVDFKDAYSLMQKDFNTIEEYDEYLDNYIVNNVKIYTDMIIMLFDDIEDGTIHFYVNESNSSTKVSAIEFIYKGEEVIILLDTEKDNYLSISLKYDGNLYQAGVYNLNGTARMYAEQYNSNATKIVNGITIWHDSNNQINNFQVDMFSEEQHVMHFVADLHVRQLDSNLYLSMDETLIWVMINSMPDNWQTQPTFYNNFNELAIQFKNLKDTLPL